MVSSIPIQALVLLMDSKMNDSLEIIVDCVLDPSDTLRFHSSLAVEPAFWPCGLTCSAKLLGSRAFLQLEGYELDQRNELVRWWVHVMFCVTCVGVGIIGVHRFLDIHRGRSGSCVFAVGSGLDALHLSRGVRSLFCVWVRLPLTSSLGLFELYVSSKLIGNTLGKYFIVYYQNSAESHDQPAGTTTLTYVVFSDTVTPTTVAIRKA
ncbi:hypothetical protein GGU10DRAFT_117135 [Lentinula aff. detonsa]|uniref:Uncharacterized protein n=1 Tax=Lentinula aff. detonsa TaxID=2804958 RepID=A0AA38KRY0_9AGAR|nr:hypothetical protein GGU10DRAFT_117135 [Lentinula aff. detonsa]